MSDRTMPPGDGEASGQDVTGSGSDTSAWFLARIRRGQLRAAVGLASGTAALVGLASVSAGVLSLSAASPHGRSANQALPAPHGEWGLDALVVPGQSRPLVPAAAQGLLPTRTPTTSGEAAAAVPFVRHGRAVLPMSATPWPPPAVRPVPTPNRPTTPRDDAPVKERPHPQGPTKPTKPKAVHGKPHGGKPHKIVPGGAEGRGGVRRPAQPVVANGQGPQPSRWLQRQPRAGVSSGLKAASAGPTQGKRPRLLRRVFDGDPGAGPVRPR